MGRIVGHRVMARWNASLRWRNAVIGAELVILIGAAIWLAHLRSRGLLQVSVGLQRDRAAVLYLPRAPKKGGTGVANLRRGKLPPVAILISGLGAGPSAMASLGRRLARNGYGALAIGIPLADFASHGTAVSKDIAEAVAYASSSSAVDGSAIVLIGHSAGAGAAMAYATEGHKIRGAVFVSGGCYLDGAVRPPNAMFLFTTRDPAAFRGSCYSILERLSGAQHPRLAETYGDFHAGTAVSEIEIPGESHIAIIGSESAAGYIIRWADRIFEIERTEPIELGDPEGFASDLVLASILALVLTIYYSWLRVRGPSPSERSAVRGGSRR